MNSDRLPSASTFICPSCGIESVGHSGPAEWCYWLTFAVVSAAAVTTLLLRQSGQSALSNTAGARKMEREVAGA